MSKAKPKLKKRGTSWEVDFGTKRRADGTTRRERKCFGTREAAQAEIRARGFETRNKAVRLTNLTEDQRHDVLTALKIIGDESIVTAAKFYMKHRPTTGPIEIRAAIEQHLAAKEQAGRRVKTLIDARSKLGRFANSFPRRYIHETMTADIECWLNGQGFTPATWESYRKALVGLFTYATRRKLVPENPVSVIERVEFDQAVPETMDVSDVRKLFRCAEKEWPNLLPHLALAFYCGLRNAELLSLDWAQIDLDESLVTVRPEVAKKRRMRHVELPENANAWLSPHWKASGSVFYSRTQFRKLRAKAEVPWPKNVARHSFASYAVAAWQDPGKVALALGHSGNPSLLFTNYRNVTTITGRKVTATLAEQFWSIVPQQRTNVVALGSEKLTA